MAFNEYDIFLKQTGLQLSPDLVVLAYFLDDMSGPPQDSIPPTTKYAAGLQYKGSVMHHSRLFNFLKSISHLVREKNARPELAISTISMFVGLSGPDVRSTSCPNHRPLRPSSMPAC